jgi:hypothetical protein
MSNVLRRSVVLCALGAFALFATGTARAGDITRWLNVQAKLAEVKKLKGFEDPKTTLQEALEMLSRSQDLTIEVNEKEFIASDYKNVLKTMIADPEPIPEFTGTLALMLRKILAKVADGQAVFIIRDGVIEITTQAAVTREFFRDRPTNAVHPPLVHAAFVNVSLTAALRDLARNSGGNVVLDVRAAKEAGTNVTAEFANVPLDTAMALLADMCGLTTVEVGNVIYVTSKENGRALQQEQEKRRLKILDRPVEPK